MDRNSAKSVVTITQGLHDETDKVFDSIMGEDFEKASKNIESMIGSLKHLKTNLKNYEI